MGKLTKISLDEISKTTSLNNFFLLDKFPRSLIDEVISDADIINILIFLSK